LSSQFIDVKNLIVIVALFVSRSACLSEEYRGAATVLKAVAGSSGKPLAGTENLDTPVKLKHDLRAFRESASGMAADQAAKEWLKFIDRFLNLRVDRDAVSWIQIEASDPDSNSITFQHIIAALPPPSTWKSLIHELEQRTPEKKLVAPTLVLRVMAHWLGGNIAASRNDIASLEKQPSPQGLSQPYAISELQWGLIQNSDNGDEVLAFLNQRLQSDAKAEYALRLQVPDLVTLVGEQRATDFLRNALRNGKGEIYVERGEATKKLARKLALEMAGELKAPQWALADSLDATALYEAMAKRFPSSERDRYERHTAQSYYLLGLIAAHRSADAAAFAMTLTDMKQSLSEEALSALEHAGHIRDLTQFFHDVLEKNPNLPFWNDYVTLAAKAFENEKMVTLAESAAARQDLDAKQRRVVLSHLHRAYLAADKIERGIEILRQELATKSEPTFEYSVPDWPRPEYDDPGIRLILVGEVLNRNELIDEGVRAVRQASAGVGNEPLERQRRAERLNRLAAELIGLNRGRQAEDVLTEALSVAPDPAKAQYSGPPQPESLSLLLALYHGAKRPEDVLTLLTQAPHWNATDLVHLLSQTVTINRSTDYVALFVADALLQSGHSAEANKIVDALLNRHAGYDPAYEYLIKLKADGTLARLDQLFALDQFEERPLIWKAKLLAASGKLEEAEKCARKAISIDPSDGEEGPGRRMMAYAVLADIREKQGDAKEAETFRNAVTAIRHSEDADGFYDAGLISRAVRMYEEALTHFADAYCIQSRLALRLVEVGDLAGAEEHYRRAYELMPDSFGRVESHCFGCERAFDGERAQSIAEKVFTELVAKRPDKPQVHYLLGYLLNVENRYSDALPEFREAVKLDPDYLNAWKELSDVGEKMRLPAKEQESIEFAKLRLDPLRRHSSFRINDVVDLKTAWAALENASKLHPKESEALFALTTSAEEIHKREKNASLGSMYGVRIFNDGSGAPLDPGSVFAQHKVMQGVIQWFNFALRSR
jgi:tetratricopeptide (TPR) repeat protein